MINGLSFAIHNLPFINIFYCYNYDKRFLVELLVISNYYSAISFSIQQFTLLSLFLSCAFGFAFLDILVEDVQLRKTVVVAGTSLELKCSSLNGTGIIWKRNGRTLGDIYNDDIKVAASYDQSINQSATQPRKH